METFAVKIINVKIRPENENKRKFYWVGKFLNAMKSYFPWIIRNFSKSMFNGKLKFKKLFEKTSPGATFE